MGFFHNKGVLEFSCFFVTLCLYFFFLSREEKKERERERKASKKVKIEVIGKTMKRR
jgi:hypothetical protein